MNIESEIAKVVHMAPWQFDGLPGLITKKLDELMQLSSAQPLIETINLIRNELEKEQQQLDANKGNSQMMHDALMNVGIRIAYLRGSVEYINKSLPTAE